MRLFPLGHAAPARVLFAPIFLHCSRGRALFRPAAGWFALLLVGALLLPAAEPSPKLYRGPVQPRWIGATARFWYRNDLPGNGAEFILVDPDAGTRVPAFDHARAATALSAATATAPGGPRTLAAVTALEFSAPPSPAAITLRFADAAWRLDLASYSVTPVTAESAAATPPSSAAERSGRRSPSRAAAPPAAAPARRDLSPDQKWAAFVRDDNLWLRERATNREIPLSTDGNPGLTYRRDASRSRLVGMQYDLPDYGPAEPDVVWSPDSRSLVARQTRPAPERRVTLVESSPADQLQPKVTSYPYLKPGDALPETRPHLFDVTTARERPLDQARWPEPWSLEQVRWTPDSRAFTVLYNRRGHQLVQLCLVEAVNGAIRVAAEERSATFVHYSRPGRHLEFLDATSEALWTSEQDGWARLYLVDLWGERAPRALTPPGTVVRGIEHVDTKTRRVWFRAAAAGGLDDPYYEQLCRVNLDGTGFAVLTPEPGTHQLTFSPDRRFVVDTWSRVDAPPVSILRRCENGAPVLPLETADASALLARRGRWPERFVAPGRDGTTPIHGIILRPPQFDPQKKYPVLERIYAGPHGYFTPKAFGAHDALVERGFIVVQLDGMGTAGRSKAFHDVAWRNIADAGFPDRIAWLRAAAARYPEMDLTRLGIFGTSAGGQSALGALLFHGDFYRAAAADCGCHDNRLDKIWWNEQWLGWPVGPHYAANSNITHAHRLQGRLFLAVGEMDRNVDPASTYRVAHALAQAGKHFEYLVLPGVGHGVFGTPYGRQRLEEFFVRTFLSGPP